MHIDFSKIDTTKYWYDETAANYALNWMENHCRHTEGEWAEPHDEFGNPRDTRIKFADWQKEQLILPFFGWKKKYKGRWVRKYRTIIMFVPKKNGKSKLAACFELAFLFIDQEPGAALYAIAPESKEQAEDLLLKPAREMIELDPDLMANCNMFGGDKVHTIVTKNARFTALTAKPEGAEGKKPQAGFVDEVHILKEDGVVENIEKSFMIRRQPLMGYFSTAGDDVTGPGYEIYERGKKILSGEIKDESTLVVIYEAEKPKGAKTNDWVFSIDAIKQANPMWDVAMNQDILLEEREKAKLSKASLAHYMRYHLNIWVSNVTGFIPDHEFWSCPGTVNYSEFVGNKCFASLDLSSTRDLTAFTIQFKVNGIVYSLNYAFLPKYGVDEDVKKRRRYHDWIDKGWIIETDGNTIDNDFITEFILKELKRYNCKGVYYDPWNKHKVIDKLEEAGVACYEFAQTAKNYNICMDEMETLVVSHKFNHGDNEVFRWNMGNLKVMTDTNGNKKPHKKEKAKNKIDMACTNLMALAGWIIDPKEEQSYLTRRDIVTLK